MKLIKLNIILSLLILISMSLLCHIKQWIPSDKFTDIKYYSCQPQHQQHQYPYHPHAELPDEPSRSCIPTSTSYYISQEDINKYMMNLYRLQANYIAFN